MLALAIALSLLGAQADLKATVTVDLTKPIGKVNPLVFGNNLEAWDSFGIFGKEHNYVTSKTAEGFWDPATRKPVEEVVQRAKDAGVKALRYPGGCLGHGYEWKKTVGPIENRPNYAFGVDEYIELCKAVGAEPLMTTGDYSETPQDVSDMVEYLNAPADSAHPWAQKRAQWGHASPYGVLFFELGNETDHGNHDLQPQKKWSAQEYVARCKDLAARIHKVSPDAKVGAHLGTSFPNVDDPWNEVVIKGLASDVDFFIIHPYSVQVFTPADPSKLKWDSLLKAALASGEQYEYYLGLYRDRVKRLAGKALPLSATEYNAMYVQEQPKTYRYSLAGGLFSADWVRVMLKPDSGILMANYWQFVNGYWGMYQNRGGAKPQAAFYLYRLWAQHFGTELVATDAVSPKLDFAQVPGAITRTAKGNELLLQDKPAGENLFKPALCVPSQTPEFFGAKREDGAIRAEFKGVKTDLHQVLANVPGKPGSSYAISFEAKASGELGGASLGLGFIDSRGWFETLSGTAVHGVQSSSEWKKYEGRFDALDDCPGITLTWRILQVSKPVSGTMEVRNLKILPVTPPRFPAYSAVTSSASLSADGKTLYVVLFNKHDSEAVKTTIKLNGGKALSAKRWVVTGPKLDSMNTATEEVRETVSGEPVKAPDLAITLPALSMTVVEVRLK